MAATTSPASRILAICSGLLICTMGSCALRHFDYRLPTQHYGRGAPSGATAVTGGRLLAVVLALECFQRPLRDLVHRAQGRDRDDQALRLLVVDDRLGLRVVDLEPL